MRVGEWLQPQRQLLLAVVVVAVVSAGALGWLGWMLVQQDAALERQRQVDRLQQAADGAASAMRLMLADLPARAAQSAGEPLSPAAGLLRADFDAAGVTLRDGGRALWVPGPVSTTETADTALGDGEALEFGGHLEGALRAYMRASRAGGPSAAAADVRVARVQRKLGRVEAALATYDRLADRELTPVEALPSSLVARVGRASVFQAGNRTSALRAEAAALRDDLLEGRWPLTRAQFTFYGGQAAMWLGAPVNPPNHDLARAEALEWAWGTGPRRARGRDPRAAIRRRTCARRVVAASRRRAFDRGRWTLPRRRVCRRGPGIALRGVRRRGGVARGRRLGRRFLVAARGRCPGGTWTVRVEPVAVDAPQTSPRRTLVVSTVALAGLVVAAGWYFILRGMARERAAGRAQADFVAAVSHEFRSPLTSMSHIAEMLASGRISGGDSQVRAYDVLVHDTDRLRTLVEQLLEFGRFEAGGPVLRLTRVDVTEAVRAIVDDFRLRASRDGYSVEYDGPASPIWMQADREALTLALWNLMDNAVKYSPDVKTIWVCLRQAGAGAELTVRDEGLGVPAREQVAIFRQFVRGEEPKSRRIRGTGIGLALVRHIARAHGGDVSVSSEAGRGSTFTLRLARAETRG